MHSRRSIRSFVMALNTSLVLLLGAASLNGQVLIEDNFNTPGTINANRKPAVTVEDRNYQKVSGAGYGTDVFYNATYMGKTGYAAMSTNVGAAVSLIDSGDFTRPGSLEIAATFNMNNVTNNTPARYGRGFYLGFWSSIPTSPTDSMANMYGIFVNPDTGRLLLWQGGATSNSTPAAELSYAGTWDASAWHTLSYCVDIDGSETGIAGNIYNFMLDGVSYDWGQVSLFTAANTNYAGFGVSASGANQMAYVDEWKVTAVPEPSTAVLLIGVVAAAVAAARRCSRKS